VAYHKLSKFLIGHLYGHAEIVQLGDEPLEVDGPKSDEKPDRGGE
jgi:hypothetical protein